MCPVKLFYGWEKFRFPTTIAIVYFGCNESENMHVQSRPNSDKKVENEN